MRTFKSEESDFFLKVSRVIGVSDWNEIDKKIKNLIGVPIINVPDTTTYAIDAYCNFLLYRLNFLNTISVSQEEKNYAYTLHLDHISNTQDALNFSQKLKRANLDRLENRINNEIVDLVGYKNVATLLINFFHSKVEMIEKLTEKSYTISMDERQMEIMYAYDFKILKLLAEKLLAEYEKMTEKSEEV